MHSHEEYVVGAIVGGAEHLEVGGVRHVAARGATLFLHPDEPHANATLGDALLRYEVLYIGASAMRAANDGKAPAFQAPVRSEPHLYAAITGAHAALRASHDQLEQETAFHALVRALSALSADTDRAIARPSTRIRRVKAFIDAHYGESFGLDALADVAGLSTFHTLRLFKREVGLTPLAYRNQVRLTHARRLLLGGAPVADAALAVGFADQSHLSRQFQRVVGVSPARYARQ